MITIKTLLRSFTVAITSLSIILSNAAVATIPELSGIDLNRVANLLNANKGNYNKLIKDFHKVAPNKAKELESFFESHPNYRNVELPRATVEGGNIVFVVEGEKNLFSIGHDGMMILAGDKKIQLKSSTPIDQMAKKIFENLTENTFSFMNFFIEEAHAFSPHAAVLIVSCFLFAYLVHSVELSDNFKAYIKKTKVWCDSIHEVDSIEDLIAINKKFYNKLGDDYIEICVPAKIIINGKGYSKEACDDLIEVKKCIKKKLDLFNDKTINNSSRAHLKEMHYEETLDRYVPDSMTK